MRAYCIELEKSAAPWVNDETKERYSGIVRMWVDLDHVQGIEAAPSSFFQYLPPRFADKHPEFANIMSHTISIRLTLVFRDEPIVLSASCYTVAGVESPHEVAFRKLLEAWENKP